MHKLYLDEDVHKKVATALRLKGYDVVRERGGVSRTSPRHRVRCSLRTRTGFTPHWHAPIEIKFPLDNFLNILYSCVA